MSFLKRTWQESTIKAIATARWGVFRDFMIEKRSNLVVSLIGTGLGFLIGFAVNFIGFTWKPLGATIPEPLKYADQVEFCHDSFHLIAAVFRLAVGGLPWLEEFSGKFRRLLEVHKRSSGDSKI
ncbi:hypothetical protein KGY71_05265 [Candidatus Bipolaricaulota bacterium]|nr:hypothetical protein [Candidatus Bipolaricaulota bacterium]